MKTYIKPHLIFIAIMAIILAFLSLRSDAQKQQSIYGHEKLAYVYAGISVGYIFQLHTPNAELNTGVKIGNYNAEMSMIVPCTFSGLAPKMLGVHLGYQISHFKPFLGATYQTIGVEREAAFKGTKYSFSNGIRPMIGCSYYIIKIPLYFTIKQLGKYTNILSGLYVTF